MAYVFIVTHFQRKRQAYLRALPHAATLPFIFSAASTEAEFPKPRHLIPHSGTRASEVKSIIPNASESNGGLYSLKN